MMKYIYFHKVCFYVCKKFPQKIRGKHVILNLYFIDIENITFFNDGYSICSNTHFFVFYYFYLNFKLVLFCDRG